MFTYKLGEKSELRLLEERHAAELTEVTDRNREHLRQWLPWLDDNRTLEDRRKFIRGTLRQLADNNGFQAGIWHEGRLTGVVGYLGVEWENRRASLGYWLAEEFEGKGLMTKSCRAFTTHAFDAYNLNHVTIACATENVKSRAIPERLGFELEGVRRQAEWLYDHFVDHALYGMLASDWKDARSCG
ncbi:MAG: GNAT family protein [Rubrobacteraceae bacterium]